MPGKIKSGQAGGGGVQPEFSWRRVIKWTCQWLTGPPRPPGLALFLPAHKGIKAQRASLTPAPPPATTFRPYLTGTSLDPPLRHQLASAQDKKKTSQVTWHV